MIAFGPMLTTWEVGKAKGEVLVGCTGRCSREADRIFISEWETKKIFTIFARIFSSLISCALQWISDGKWS